MSEFARVTCFSALHPEALMGVTIPRDQVDVAIAFCKGIRGVDIFWVQAASPGRLYTLPDGAKIHEEVWTKTSFIRIAGTDDFIRVDEAAEIADLKKRVAALERQQ